MDALMRSGGPLDAAPTWSQLGDAGVRAPAEETTPTSDNALVAMTMNDEVKRRSDKTGRDMSLRASVSLDGNACDYRQEHRRPRQLSTNFKDSGKIFHRRRPRLVESATSRRRSNARLGHRSWRRLNDRTFLRGPNVGGHCVATPINGRRTFRCSRTARSPRRRPPPAPDSSAWPRPDVARRGPGDG